MSEALRICSGPFGRVALLDMDRSLVRHAHPHCHVLLKVEGADTSFMVGDRRAHLTDESAVLIDAWTPHAYVHQTGAPRTVILALYIEPAWLGGFRKNWLSSADAGFFRTSNGETTAKIRALAQGLSLSMVTDPGARAEHEKQLADLMIAVIERFSEWREARASLSALARINATDPRVVKAVGLMRAEPGASESMTELAQRAGMSRATFFRLFERDIGVTPRMYLNVVRLEQAVSATVGGGDSFSAISDRLGFSTPAHFSRFFSDHAGVPPSRFRQVAQIASV